jgi:ABC-2 type transport system ATP-binding protein
MIQINHLSKAYNSGNVLTDISIKLEEGRIYGLIGANGSGKSTLIKCISGIYSPDKGEVKMGEDSIYNSAKCKEKIGLILDTMHFLPMYSVNSYAKYYASFYKDFSFDKFNEFLNRFGISPKAYAESLSLGNKKKLQIALVLSRNIDFLLMDEPENGLDNESREIFRNIVRECADQGIGILLSSHDLLNIENMCDDLIFVDDGVIKYYGGIDERLSTIQKWRVRGPHEKLSDYTVLEDLGNVFTILTEGDYADNKKELEMKEIDVIDSDKVTVVDAYTLMRRMK